MAPPRGSDRRRRRRLTYERRITLLAVLAGAPGVALALLLLWTGDYSPRLQWTLTVLVFVAWAMLVATLRERTIRPIQTLANLLSALHEGDYSMRPAGGPTDDALGLAFREVQALGQTLRQQRLGALEATALLRKVMAEIDVAVFTFDHQRKLRLVNRAGERLLARPAERLLGRTIEELGLAEVMGVETGGSGDGGASVGDAATPTPAPTPAANGGANGPTPRPVRVRVARRQRGARSPQARRRRPRRPPLPRRCLARASRRRLRRRASASAPPASRPAGIATRGAHARPAASSRRRSRGAPGAGRSAPARSARAGCPTPSSCSPTSRGRCGRRSGRPGSGWCGCWGTRSTTALRRSSRSPHR